MNPYLRPLYHSQRLVDRCLMVTPTLPINSVAQRASQSLRAGRSLAFCRVILRQSFIAGSCWLGLLLLVTGSAWGQCFGPATNYGAGDSPYSVAVGDVNADGRPDLITANSFSNNVSVLLGQSGGGFGPATNYGVDIRPFSVVVGDVNADGRPDIITANLSNNVSVLLGQSGGGFGPATNYGAGVGTFSVAVGDVNADGRADLITANNNSNNVSVLLGQSGGGFGPATNYGVNDEPRSVAVRDVNADGRPDIITANIFSDNVSVLLGQSGGGFGPATNYRVHDGDGPASVAVGDVNADGRPDIITANIFSDNVSVLLGQSGGGFGPATNYRVHDGDGPASVAVGDVNVDGRADLITANVNGDNVSVLLGQSGGGFGPATNYGVGDGPFSVVVGDVNADGRPDIITANVITNNVSVLLNGAPVAITRQPPSGSAVCVGSTVTASVSVTGTSPAYQWYKDGQPLTGVASATTATLSLTDVQLTSTGTYSVVVTGDCASSLTSTAFSLTVSALPTAGLTNNGPLSCTTTSVTLTASGGNTGETLSYRFSSGASQIGNGSTATVSTAGVYSVTVVSGIGCSSVASTTVVGEPNVPPAIISQSQSATTICAGEGVNFYYALSFGSGGGRADFYRDNTFLRPLESNPTNYTSSGGRGFAILQSGSYQIVVTGSCTSVTTTYASIVVNPLPTAYNVTGGGAYCTGGTGAAVGLAGSQTGVTYQLLRDGSAVGSPLAGTGSALSFGNQTAVGTYTVRATNATTDCQQTMSGSVSVTVNPLPTPYTVTGGGNFCAGTAGVALGLTGSQTGVNYQLLRGGNNVGNSVAGTGSAISFGNQTVAGTYTVLATSAGTACQQTITGSAVVTVNPAPVVSVTNPAPVCSPATVNLNTAVSSDIQASFAFFTNAGLTTSVANPGAVASSGTYYVQATSGAGCLSSPKAISVTVNALPLAGLTNNGPISCSMTSVTLTASDGSTYRFSTGANQISNGPTATVSQAGVYSVTVVNSNGCSATASTTVTGDVGMPTATLSNDGPLSCTMTSVRLTASGGGTYRFSAGATQAGNSPTATVSSAGVYSVTVVGSNGCSATVSTTVDSNQTLPPATLTNNGPLSCLTTTVTLTASGGGTYQFSSGATQVGSSPTATVNRAGVYSVTVAGANGCSAVASTTVTGNQNPPTASLTNNGPLSCTVPSITLTSSGGGTYRFSNGATQVGTSSTATVSSAGVYSVTVVGGNGCSSVASTTVVGDQRVPTASLTNNGPISCSTTSVTLTASGGNTYRFSNGVSQVSNRPTATVTTAGAYSVTVISTNGCSATASTTVVGDVSVPVAGLTNNGPISCSMSSVTLTASGGSTYRFSSGANQIGNGPTATVSSAGVYSVTVTSTNGCSAVAQTTVTSGGGLPLAFTSQPASTSTVGPTTSVATSVAVTGTEPLTYQWYKDGTGLASQTEPTLSLTNVQPSDAGRYVVVVTSTCSLVRPVSLTSTAFNLIVTPLPVGSPAQLTVLSRDPDNGRLGTNTLKPYLQLRNDGSSALPYGELTLRYWLTLEDPAPLRYDINYAQLGSDKVHLRYVPLTPAVPGASGYIEFSFDASAGNLGAMSDSGPIQDLINKQDYSYFNQGDDYSYVNNAGFTPNPHITAYLNGALIYGQEPAGPVVITPLTLTVSASPATISTSGTTTLSAVASGGTPGPGYRYYFVGPGTLSATGNTATASALTAGVQTFTVTATDATSPVNQSIATTVSVTVTAPANTPPVPTANANQTATVGQAFTYVVNAFTDDTPNSLTYTARISPANGLTFDAATRLIQGTPTSTGVSSVTITATDPGGLSASTVFTITVNAQPVAPTALTLTASANPTTILTTGSTQLQANAWGGTPGYTYTFSGPGSIQTNNSTATVSGLSGGVQTFTVTARDATSPVNQTIATTVSVTVTAPANQAPVATANANQTATQNMPFSYVVNPFTDDTPNNLTYSASVVPANGLTFNPATRAVRGTPTSTGVSTVTVTATDSGGLSASTVFTITVNPAPVVTDRLTVLSRDPENGNLYTNTLKPYLLLQNDGAIPIPYGELTLRYYLTLENPMPLRFDVNYAQMGNDKVHFQYVPLTPARQGASGYIEFSFDATAGSLAPMSNAVIQDLINKQDYSNFFQGDDYSYINNPNFAPNDRITAYRNGVLIYGVEPPSAVRIAAGEADQPLRVTVLGNPVTGASIFVSVSGAEGQALHYELTDVSGHRVGERQVEQAGSVDQQSLSVSHQPAGLFLLRVSTPTQSQTVKVLRQ